MDKKKNLFSSPSGGGGCFPIGVFDSGIGGLTVLKEIVKKLPQYDYVYLGDSARAPYGSRSFETVYHYTLECVKKLFEMNCHLVILACNTASAKALRNIQQLDLPRLAPERRVLGVIRPTAEVAGKLTKTGRVGVLGTAGTVQSDSYKIEIEKFFPHVKVFQQACPMWVPIVENNEMNSPAADIFIKKYLKDLFSKSKKTRGERLVLGVAEGSRTIDTVILGCTHYPILLPKIKKRLPKGVKAVSQGSIVAASLADYLSRHPEMERLCSKGGTLRFLTTDSTENFNKLARVFWKRKFEAEQISV